MVGDSSVCNHRNGFGFYLDSLESIGIVQDPFFKPLESTRIAIESTCCLIGIYRNSIEFCFKPSESNRIALDPTHWNPLASSRTHRVPPVEFHTDLPHRPARPCRIPPFRPKKGSCGVGLKSREAYKLAKLNLANFRSNFFMFTSFSNVGSSSFSVNFWTSYLVVLTILQLFHVLLPSTFSIPFSQLFHANHPPTLSVFPLSS